MDTIEIGRPRLTGDVPGTLQACRRVPIDTQTLAALGLQSWNAVRVVVLSNLGVTSRVDGYHTSMLWFVLIVLLMVIGVGMWIFNRRSREVESELTAEGVNLSTPVNGYTRRRVERRSNELSGPGTEQERPPR